ncbi:serine O-acetyltransferase [Ruegeria sp. AU67]|uniref:serine O-acetyltransferase n=1 Tax=Ruegeria sp. AU67 TaxID=2108530 RepID=UPI000D6956DF|nr:serine acetyltransferase [Ruegeria sp. AU67]
MTNQLKHIGPETAAATQICDLRELYDYIREDKKVNDNSIFRPGFQAMAVYRFGVWRQGISPRWFRILLSFMYRIMYVFVRNVYGIELPSTAIIGRRLRVAHQNSIVVHPEAVIGDDCMIRQGVSIGISRVARSGDNQRVAPMLGNRVEVGANATIIGPVSIGSDVAIGPNTVVIADIPDNSIVMVPLPRVIPRPTGVQGSERLG